MRPRKTANSNSVIRLPGGNEDNDLHARVGIGLPGLPADDPCAGGPYIAAVYEPEQAERAAIATGANLELVIHGQSMPPVSLGVTREQPLSRPQRGGDDPRIWLELPLDVARDIRRALRVRLAALHGYRSQAPAEGAELKRLHGLEADLNDLVVELERHTDDEETAER